MRKFLFALPFVPLLLPYAARAHEVYVLTQPEIANGLSMPPFDMLAVVRSNLGQFVFWAFITFVVISTIFFVSLFRVFERNLDPLFARGKKYAPLICRVTVGLGLLAGAYYQASFGPELPYAPAFGTLAPLITAVVVAIGLCFIAGIWVRQAALFAMLLFGYAIYRNGIYMFTYANYFGEFLVLFLFATHARGTRHHKWPLGSIENAFASYEPAIVRICFGISLLYSSLYAKILHNNLALQVASLPLAGHPYGIAHYFGFDPQFMVLGAAIIEIIIALFFILGIEIRWTCVFLEFWLALSLWWFGEAVWPHLILIGIPVALFLWGYDSLSLEGYYFKRGRREPVL